MENYNFEGSITSASENASTLDCNGLVYRFVQFLSCPLTMTYF